MSPQKTSATHAPTVLICGASGGLGIVLGKHLTDQGMHVFGTMRDPSRAPKDLPFDMLPLDATNDASIKACFDDVISRTGRIDVVINCVNQMILGSVEETSLEEVESLYNTNLFGAMRIAKHATAQMKTQAAGPHGRGTLVTMSSLGGLLAVPLLSTYTSCKFALEAFSEALYHEMKPHDINVVIMQPVAMRMERAENGTHIGVAANTPQASPTRRMFARMEKETRTSNLTPQKVSEEIYAVLTAKKKPLRVPLDRAKGLSLIKRFARQSVIDRLIKKAVPPLT